MKILAVVLNGVVAVLMWLVLAGLFGPLLQALGAAVVVLGICLLSYDAVKFTGPVPLKVEPLKVEPLKVGGTAVLAGVRPVDYWTSKLLGVCSRVQVKHTVPIAAFPGECGSVLDIDEHLVHPYHVLLDNGCKLSYSADELAPTSTTPPSWTQSDK
jgi:hypothetical protein